MQAVIQKLGLATPHDNPTPRQNNSLNNASVELLKIINRYDIKAKDKELLMPHLKKINEILDSYPSELLIEEGLKKTVLEIYRPVKL